MVNLIVSSLLGQTDFLSSDIVSLKKEIGPVRLPVCCLNALLEPDDTITLSGLPMNKMSATSGTEFFQFYSLCIVSLVFSSSIITLSTLGALHSHYISYSIFSHFLSLNQFSENASTNCSAAFPYSES